MCGHHGRRRAPSNGPERSRPSWRPEGRAWAWCSQEAGLCWWRTCHRLEHISGVRLERAEGRCARAHTGDIGHSWRWRERQRKLLLEAHRVCTVCRAWVCERRGTQHGGEVVEGASSSRRNHAGEHDMLGRGRKPFLALTRRRRCGHGQRCRHWHRRRLSAHRRRLSARRLAIRRRAQSRRCAPTLRAIMRR